MYYSIINNSSINNNVQYPVVLHNVPMSMSTYDGRGIEKIQATDDEKM